MKDFLPFCNISFNRENFSDAEMLSYMERTSLLFFYDTRKSLKLGQFN